MNELTIEVTVRFSRDGEHFVPDQCIVLALDGTEMKANTTQELGECIEAIVDQEGHLYYEEPDNSDIPYEQKHDK